MLVANNTFIRKGMYLNVFNGDKESEMKIRAIYMPDIACDLVPIFELQNGKFACLSDQEVKYDMGIVLADNDWIIVVIEDDGETHPRR